MKRLTKEQALELYGRVFVIFACRFNGIYYYKADLPDGRLLHASYTDPNKGDPIGMAVFEKGSDTPVELYQQDL